MRFAVAASDRYLGVWQAFVEQGWTPLKLIIVPSGNRLDPNRDVLEYARKHAVDVQASPLCPADLAQLERRGCEALIVASYDRRIGDWRPYLRYAVNFHPSPLPLGRGPYPLVSAILDGHRSWAVTCHRLDPEFDSGPVLASRSFELSTDECHESLIFKVQREARALAGQVAGRFDEYWRAARPQGAGTYIGWWTAAQRTLDFSQEVEAILRVVRAFGLLECLAILNDVTLHVRRVVGWRESHAYQPGSVVHASGMQLLVAARDGFVGIVEWSLLAADAAVGTSR